MNYYDINDASSLATRGYKFGLKRKRLAPIYKVLTIIVAVLAAGLIIWSSSIKYSLYIFVSAELFLILILIATIRISVKKAQKLALSDRHDYNLALYRTIYKNNKKLQSVALLQMARQQILMAHYDLAAQALEEISADTLKRADLRSFYFYRAAVLFLQGLPEWEAELDKCYAVPGDQSQLKDDEIAALFLSGNVKEDISETIEKESSTVSKWPIGIIITAVYILCWGIYWGISGLLPDGYNYRYWVQVLSTSVTYLGAVALVWYWIIRFISFKNKLTTIKKNTNVFQNICLIIIGICLSLIFLICQFLAFLNTDKEIAVYPDGLIYMSAENGYTTSYYYNKKVGPFLRRSLTTEEFAEYRVGQHSDEDDSETTDSETVSSENTDSKMPDSENTDSKPENSGITDNDIADSNISDNSNADNTENPLHNSAKAVCSYLVNAGQLPETDMNTLSYGYSAKGDFYAVFETGQTEGRNYENRLVYDRPSENGQCDLFVYQQFLDGADTVILGFYAVNKDTGEVFSADRTTWSGSSSEPYKNATGEN